jgi:hypothetical protein
MCIQQKKQYTLFVQKREFCSKIIIGPGTEHHILYYCDFKLTKIATVKKNSLWTLEPSLA